MNIKQLRKDNLDQIIEDLYDIETVLEKKDTLVIISNDEPNDTILQKLKYLFDHSGIFLVINAIKRLQFNILEHALVPPHRVLLESEVETVMKRYNITSKIQFPDISRFDPVARVIGLRPGQVCHIIRPSKTAIEANYYRVCI